MTTNSDNLQYRITRRGGDQGAHPPMANQIATGLKLLKARTTSLASTFNANTLQQDYKLCEIAAVSMEIGLDVIFIQEHRLFHEDIVCKIHDIGKGWKFYTGSATKNKLNSMSGYPNKPKCLQIIDQYRAYQSTSHHCNIQ